MVFSKILLLLFAFLSLTSAYRGSNDERRRLHENLRRREKESSDTTKKGDEWGQPPPPTNSPSSSPITVPSGPYIAAETANELISLPNPTVPLFHGRSNCPHEANDLLDWHSSSTWSGDVPRSGHVTLPDNTKIIVRQSVVGILGTVTIPASSELVFGESPDGITFDTYGIDVRGKLTIGSETCRIENPIIITLHGDRPNDAVTNVPTPVFKGISVTGYINVHGKRFYRTWARLALTVEPGDDIVMLQHNANWEPGQQVILVTTAMKDSREWHRNEVVVVKHVLQNPAPGVGAAVYLEAPARFQHLAIGAYQGEVGLLTRQVKIQGNLASEPTDPDPLDCTFGTTAGADRSLFGNKNRPCPNTELTGYGGHIMVHQGGKGYIEGVELYRMGQTNVLGRYPMHFHVLGDCADCYFRDSSVHRSFFRCVSIHGSNYIEVSENVAFDVTGFCYYLEDGVEHHNRIEFNLGAHIHIVGPEPPFGSSLNIHNLYQQNESLILPADTTAAAFYITNIQNDIIGNAASGGWAGFSFPNLPTPLGKHRTEKVRPSAVTGLTMDGNTAHSTGWWWKSSAGFYWGGSLYYNDDNVLEYNAGRDLGNRRSTCLVNKCLGSAGCDAYCRAWEQAWLRVTNTKAFLVAGVGFSSWNGRLELQSYECHDCGLSLQSLSDGFWGNRMLAVCRTNVPIVLPKNAQASQMRADGFRWYDTGQEHIITDATFRNCGYRSDEFDQYNQNSDRGCGDENDIGCRPDSSVWSFVTHSDQHVPEMMQATRAISFENCGRRFYQRDWRQDSSAHPSSVSAREQNWYDVDGSVTGFGEPSIIASGLTDSGLWWKIDDEAVYDPQGPLWFLKLNTGPQRAMGHFQMEWDNDLHSQIGTTQCGNQANIPCDYVGYIKHLGNKFADDLGLPVTANADIVGPVGGFGWKLELDGGSPKSLRFDEIEVDPDTPLLLSIAYPPGTSFTITAHAKWCTDSEDYTCTESFYEVDSIMAVRNSLGNTYHVDSQGVLTFRIIQLPKTFVGRPDFFLPKYSDVGKNGNGFALHRFERDGVLLPMYGDGCHLTVDADCPSLGAYCSEAAPYFDPGVCAPGYVQTAYDCCTSASNPSFLIFADGSSSKRV